MLIEIVAENNLEINQISNNVGFPLKMFLKVSMKMLLNSFLYTWLILLRIADEQFPSYDILITKISIFQNASTHAPDCLMTSPQKSHFF